MGSCKWGVFLPRVCGALRRRVSCPHNRHFLAPVFAMTLAECVRRFQKTMLYACSLATSTTSRTLLKNRAHPASLVPCEWGSGREDFLSLPFVFRNYLKFWLLSNDWLLRQSHFHKKQLMPSEAFSILWNGLPSTSLWSSDGLTGVTVLPVFLALFVVALVGAVPFAAFYILSTSVEFLSAFWFFFLLVIAM